MCLLRFELGSLAVWEELPKPGQLGCPLVGLTHRNIVDGNEAVRALGIPNVNREGGIKKGRAAHESSTKPHHDPHSSSLGSSIERSKVGRWWPEILTLRTISIFERGFGLKQIRSRTDSTSRRLHRLTLWIAHKHLIRVHHISTTTPPNKDYAIFKIRLHIRREVQINTEA